MSSTSAYKEFTGKSVEEALRLAREEFGVGLDDLDFEILTPGSRGVLGMGAEPARILAAPRSELGGAAPKREAAATRPLPAPPPRERDDRGRGRGFDRDRGGGFDRDRGPRRDDRGGPPDRGPRRDDRGGGFDRPPRRDDRGGGSTERAAAPTGIAAGSTVTEPRVERTPRHPATRPALPPPRVPPRELESVESRRP